MPLAAAGIRTEPPVSEPRLPNAARKATAAPEPLDEPPAMQDGSIALRQSPQAALWPVAPSANSAMLSDPMENAPAAASRCTTVAESAGT